MMPESFYIGQFCYFVRIGDSCLFGEKLVTVKKIYFRNNKRYVIFDDEMHCWNTTAGLYRVNFKGEKQLEFILEV